ncbi:MAG TPA: hypothetical protein PLP65_06800 [Bacteroidales bacterium]|nr:hypothetical protein [Bacteroidales bacterium]
MKQKTIRKARFEHRKQKVIPFQHFVIRMGRYTLFALFLIFISLMIGIIGYHFLGGIGWIDSFHMSSMILTGMGPVTEMTSKAAKIFSSFYALYSGVAFLSITAVFFAPVIHRILHILQVEVEDDEQNK